MRVEIGKRAMSLEMGSGSTLEVENLETTSNLYVNGENAEEAITEYLDAHPELLGNDTLSEGVYTGVETVPPSTERIQYNGATYSLLRDGATVSTVRSPKIYKDYKSSADDSTYSVSYINGKFEEVEESIPSATVVGTTLVIG